MDQRTTQRFCSPTGKMVTMISGRLGAWKPETGEQLDTAYINHELSQGFKLRVDTWVACQPTTHTSVGLHWTSLEVSILCCCNLKPQDEPMCNLPA
jgi:hypothetical protein